MQKLWSILLEYFVLVCFLYLMALIVLPFRITKRFIPVQTIARILALILRELEKPEYRNLLRSLKVLAVIGGGILFIGGAWTLLDNSGWLSHSRETQITAKYDWLEGESKTCVSQPVDPDTARVMKLETYDVTTAINCDNGESHQIKVIFWGRTTRPERSARYGVSWKCTKKRGEFICYSLD